MEINTKIEAQNAFLKKIHSLNEWQSTNPFDSYFQGPNFNFRTGYESLDQEVLRTRLTELFNFPEFEKKFLVQVKMEGPSLVQLLRLLPFYPNGLSIDILEIRGFSREKLTIWENKSLIYSLDKNPEGLFQGYHNIFLKAFLPWSFLINEFQPLMIPIRRLTIPLSIILHKVSPEKITDGFQVMLDFTIKANQKSKSNGTRDRITCLNFLKTLLAGVNFQGQKIVFGVALLEFFYFLENFEKESRFIELMDNFDIDSFFSNIGHKESSIFHFAHPGAAGFEPDNAIKISAYAIELPVKILYSAISEIVAQKIKTGGESFFHTENNECSEKRKKLQNQMIQLLAMIFIFNPQRGDNYPIINYLPIESNWDIVHSLFPWIFSYFSAINCLEKSSSVWRITKNAFKINDYSTDHTLIQFFRYLMWHPGLPFLNKVENVSDRTEEQIKNFLLSAFYGLRGQWIDFSLFMLFPEPGLKKNGAPQPLERVIEQWIHEFPEKSILEKYLESLIDFLADLGWVWKSENQVSKKFFITNDFPLWNSMGNLPEIPNEMEYMEENPISFVADLDFKFHGNSLKDMVFMSKWCDLLRSGSFLLYHINREKIESFLANGFDFAEIENFMEKRLSGKISQGFLAIKENIRSKGFSALYYENNHVLVIKNITQIQELLQHPGLISSSIKSFEDKNGNNIILIDKDHKEYVLELFRQNDIVLSIMRSPQNIDYSSYTQKDDKRPLIFDFFSQRLVLYFHKIGVANIFSENDLKEISLESQDITQSKLKNLISEAIEKGWKLEIQYFAKSNEYRGMFRIIKPYKLEKDHLLAYCYLRDDNRMFLLNRIGSVSTVKD